MEESAVKEQARKWLDSQGYEVTCEVGVSGTQREVILDLYGYREKGSEPQIIWVECKGDQNLSQLLEGWIRVEFAVFLGGGKGVLAVPHKACKKLLTYRIFLSQDENIKLFDVETQQMYRLNRESDG